MENKLSLVTYIRRWAFLLLVSLIGSLLIVYTTHIINDVKTHDDQIRNYFFKQQRELLRSQVQNTIVIMEYEIKADDINNSEDHLHNVVLNYTNKHRFGHNNNGYIWVYELLDIEGGGAFARMYATPNLLNQIRIGDTISDSYKDIHGKQFRKEYLKGLREYGECYVDYFYKPLDASEPRPKTSFFKLAGEGRFIVAAGLYKDDIEKRILASLSGVNKRIWNGFIAICSIFIVALLIVLFLADQLSKKVKRDLQIFEKFFKFAADSSLSIIRKDIKFLELDKLAAYTNSMLAQKNKAEANLKKTQKQLGQAQEIAQIGHYVLDIRSKNWLNSPELDNILGIDEHYDKNLSSWAQIIHPDRQDTVCKYFNEQVIGRHKKFNLEFRIFDQKTGREKWVHGLGDLKFNENGEPVEMFGTIQDITERKKMDESLRRTQFIFDRASIGIFHLSSDGQILNVNVQGAKSLGYTPDELKGMTVFDIDPGVSPGQHPNLWKMLLNKKENRHEGFHLHKNGQTFPVDITANLFEYQGKQFAVSFVRDITDQKKVEQALRDSEERLRGIVNSMADWIWEINLEGRYSYCSENVIDLLGYFPEEIIGKTPFDFMTPNEAIKIEKSFRKIVAQKTNIKDLENWKRSKDGKEICIITNGVPIIDTNGGLLGYRGVDKNITEQKQAEKERRELETRLQQAQKMEAIGTLAGGIAHDFNNILSGIMGYTQLAMMDANNPERISRNLNKIINGTRRASDLTKQILTFSRQSEYQKYPFKIYTEIKEALKLIRSTIPATIEIKTDIFSTKSVMADPIRIHQVVMNLCTNAYHAMRKTGGTLTVSLTDVTLSNSDVFKNKKVVPGEYVKLEITDNGHGMNEEQIKKAFEPYFTTKEKGDGTGLGLALVQAIVEEHDGFLNLHSKIDKGTSFYLYFPVVREDKSHHQQKNQLTHVQNGREKVMFVDDESYIRESTKDFLEKYGYQVVIFQNGRDALDTFKSNPSAFDIIITDMTMPEFTGAQLAKEILTMTPDMPIVLCTGFSENISPAEALEIGFREYIQKPFRHQEIAALIRRILDKKDNCNPIII